jgi:hypothetical protein
MVEAPFDFLADQLRGFKAITMDIRRCPDKVKAAVEVITPLLIKMAIPPVIRPGLITFIPLHLAPFINMKAFEELYWPTFEKTIVELDKAGIACSLFVEQDWTRYCEYLERLPNRRSCSWKGATPNALPKPWARITSSAAFTIRPSP